jgi:hypothetical protein
MKAPTTSSAPIAAVRRRLESIVTIATYAARHADEREAVAALELIRRDLQERG